MNAIFEEKAETNSSIAIPIDCEVGLFSQPLPFAVSFGIPSDAFIADEIFVADDEVPLAFRESMEQIRLGQVIDLDDVLNEPEDE
jgi:hypothetical protein